MTLVRPPNTARVVANFADDWLGCCQKPKSSDPLPNLANAAFALREDPALSHIVAYDEMLRATILTRPMPTWDRPNHDPHFLERPLTDTDANQFQEWLQLAGIKSVGRETAHQALDLYAH